MQKYFGTDGFRGEVGITLTADHAYKVGRFLGWYYNALRERNGDSNPVRIVIGKDTRRSSYMLEYRLVTLWLLYEAAIFTAVPFVFLSSGYLIGRKIQNTKNLIRY